jgi:23S rRNA-/tRNA-specific pseudouridylate synthase
MVLEKGFYGGYPATKVLMAPITGRRHQLRQEKQHLDHAC